MRFHFGKTPVPKWTVWAFLVAGAMAFLVSKGAAKDLKVLAVTDPRLCSLTSFIGGVNLKALPLTAWNPDGSLFRLKSISGDAPQFFMALDKTDALQYGFNVNGDNIVLLYGNCPVKDKVKGIFDDPAKLPFVGQRILVAISGIDPEGYEYYQRRFAEFQSRLDSTLAMGRKVLKGAKVLDLNGSQGEFLKAAGCEVEVPDEALNLRIWSVLNSRDQGSKKALSALGRDLDASFDAVVLDRPFQGYAEETGEIVSKIPVMVFFTPLESAQDPVSVMYDRYLAVWNVLRNSKNKP